MQVNKDQSRLYAKNIHKSIGPQLLSSYDVLIRQQLERLILNLNQPKSIGWHYPITPMEPDIWPLVIKMLESDRQGHTHSLVASTDQQLEFQVITRETKFESYKNIKHHILHPVPPTSTIIPDIIITPALGFNPKGARLGWGKGLYDRYAQNLENPVDFIGIAYPWQSHLPFREQRHDLLCQYILNGVNNI